MRLIDTHVHLEEVEDLPGALDRARQAGVEAIIAVGSTFQSNKRLLEICEDCKNFKIYLALGIHPSDLTPEDMQAIAGLIEENIERIVAIGETGLDYWYKEARKEGPGRQLQKEAYSAQLDLAVKYNKPAIIHSRGAWRDCLDMAVEKKVKKAVFYWYSGPIDVLSDLLNQGYLISAAPSAEYSPEHREVIKNTPVEKILLETDSPVTYKPESGKYRSEPKDVARTLKAVAQIKDMEEGRMANEANETAIKFFEL